MNTQLESQIKNIAKTINIPPGWWCVGKIVNSTCVKIAVFMTEPTARNWASKNWSWDCGYYNVICQT